MGLPRRARKPGRPACCSWSTSWPWRGVFGADLAFAAWRSPSMASHVGLRRDAHGFLTGVTLVVTVVVALAVAPLGRRHRLGRLGAVVAAAERRAASRPSAASDAIRCFMLSSCYSRSNAGDGRYHEGARLSAPVAARLNGSSSGSGCPPAVTAGGASKPTSTGLRVALAALVVTPSCERSWPASVVAASAGVATTPSAASEAIRAFHDSVSVRWL